MICGMLQRFEMRLAEEYNPRLWEQELKDYFVTTRGKLPVVLTPRQVRGVGTGISAVCGYEGPEC